MSKTLVIIEAPNKKSKLSHILGDDYNIQASVGHIMDLDAKEMSIDLETFTPQYIICPDKHDVVKNLKKENSKCDNILIATDGDAEGCAIAWSIAQALKIDKPKRIIFNEITEKAIKNAIKNPVDIDMNLFHSQQARRMLDRVIGYLISPLLWKAMQGSKSAGRVQSVVTRLICEKEEEIDKFFENENQSSYFKTTANFNEKYNAILYTTKEQKDDEEDEEENAGENNDKNKEIKKSKKQANKLKIAKVKDADDMKYILKHIGKSEFFVKDVTEKESLRQPSAPFTTDSLIQTSHQKLGFTTQRTTSAAQNLYAAGYITYIRTDSPNISEVALKDIGKLVNKNYGVEYHRELQYLSKAKDAQCAHECIRPTDIKLEFLQEKDKCKGDEINLYKLIWKRTVASQMTPAKFKISTVEIDISKNDDYKFISEYESCIFDGFMRVYNDKLMKNGEDEGDENIGDNEEKNKKIKLPKKNDVLEISNVTSTQEYKKPPARYDDGTIIGKMKKLGIGRPSTYNSIIKKIQDVNYVVIKNNEGLEKESLILKLKKKEIEEEKKKITLGKDSKKCVPTEMGKAVTQFLLKYFPEIMDYKFTSDMEDKLDEIAEGKLKHTKMLKDFYKNFKPLINKINESVVGGLISLKDMKEIGIHPELKHKIYTMMAKFGPIVQMIDDNNKIINTAPIKEPLKIKTITVDDAVKLFEYPKVLGKSGRKIVKLYKGQYGFYLKYGDDNLSLKIDEEQAKNYTLELALERIEENKKKILWEGKDKVSVYTILEGPYGKFINVVPIKKTTRTKAKNFKLPENEDLTKLDVEKVIEFIKNSYSSRFKKNKTKEETKNGSKDKDKIKDKPKDKIKEKIENKIKKEVKEKTKPKKISKEEQNEMDDIFNIKKDKDIKKPKKKKIEKEKI